MVGLRVIVCVRVCLCVRVPVCVKRVEKHRPSLSVTLSVTRFDRILMRRWMDEYRQTDPALMYADKMVNVGVI